MECGLAPEQLGCMSCSQALTIFDIGLFGDSVMNDSPGGLEVTMVNQHQGVQVGCHGAWIMMIGGLSSQPPIGESPTRI